MPPTLAFSADVSTHEPHSRHRTQRFQRTCKYALRNVQVRASTQITRVLRMKSKQVNHPSWGSNPRPQGQEPCALPTELDWRLHVETDTGTPAQTLQAFSQAAKIKKAYTVPNVGRETFLETLIQHQPLRAVPGGKFAPGHRLSRTLPTFSGGKQQTGLHHDTGWVKHGNTKH